MADLTRVMTDMGHDEALDKHNQLKTLATFARQLLLEMRDRNGWRVLGFSSFEEYGEKEWGYSRTYINRLATAEAIQKSLAVPIGTEIPESQLRPLAKIPEADRKAIFDAAKSKADLENKAVTAKLVEDAVADYKLKNEQLREGMEGLIEEMDGRAEKIAEEKVAAEKLKLQANVDQIAMQLEADYAARIDNQSDVISRLRNELALLKDSQANRQGLSADEELVLEEKIQALHGDITRLTTVRQDLERENNNRRLKHFALIAINNMNGLVYQMESFNTHEIRSEILDEEIKGLLEEAISVTEKAKDNFLMLTNSHADPEKKGKEIKPLGKVSLAELKDIAIAPVLASAINPGVKTRLLSDGLIEFELRPSLFKSHNGFEVQYAKITQDGLEYLESIKGASNG